MMSIKILSDEFSAGSVDREIVAALWSICHLGRARGVHPDGMLPRNDLISDEHIAQLDDWLCKISYAVFALLDGCDAATAFEPFDKGG